MTTDGQADDGRDGSERDAERRTIVMVKGEINSGDLFVGTRAIMINHGGQMYRLQLTAQNKLILTK